MSAEPTKKGLTKRFQGQWRGMVFVNRSENRGMADQMCYRRRGMKDRVRRSQTGDTNGWKEREGRGRLVRWMASSYERDWHVTHIISPFTLSPLPFHSNQPCQSSRGGAASSFHPSSQSIGIQEKWQWHILSESFSCSTSLSSSYLIPKNKLTLLVPSPPKWATNGLNLLG